MPEKIFLRNLEDGIAELPKEEQAKVFRRCAVGCLKDTVLKELRRQFEECGEDLDAQFQKYGQSEYFFAKVLVPSHVYEMGYPKCLCPVVQSGFAQKAIHCECSRQGFLYILEDLLPSKKIEVETIGTVLSGRDKCTFKVTVK